MTGCVGVKSGYDLSSLSAFACVVGVEAMPALNLSVGHRLSQDEALRRIRAAVSRGKAQRAEKINQLRDGWNDYVGAFDGSGIGQKASGMLAVNPSDVRV